MGGFVLKSAFFSEIMMSTINEKIKNLISPTLTDIGLWVVNIRIMGGDNKVLQIMVDRLDGTPVDVNDCENASRSISAILDVEDPIQTAYNLEVSTPGIDRPLVRHQDWEKFVGFEVKVELKTQTETGRRRYRGIIEGIDNDVITLVVDNNSENIDFNNIFFAKLVLTDELIKFCSQEVEAINK